MNWEWSICAQLWDQVHPLCPWLPATCCKWCLRLWQRAWKKKSEGKMKLYFLVSLGSDRVYPQIGWRWKLTCHTFFLYVVIFVYKVTNQICPCGFDTEPSKELRSMLRHLVEMLAAPSVSGPGRDSTINLLIKQVPRKSLKNPDNSLTLWLTDQGM